MTDEPPDLHSSFISSLTELAKQAHANSAAKGFWEAHAVIRDLVIQHRPDLLQQYVVQWKLSRFGLIHSEVSEGTEGVRKGLVDDHLPHRSMEVAELADTVIRIMDYAGAYELPLAQVILEKMSYNTRRARLHGDKLA